jgi:hypothetical protein
MNPPEGVTGSVRRAYRGGMIWTMLAIWGASVAIGAYVGKQRGGVDALSDGIGWPLILGPLGLGIFLYLSRPSRSGQPQTQPD